MEKKKYVKKNLSLGRVEVFVVETNICYTMRTRTMFAKNRYLF